MGEGDPDEAIEKMLSSTHSEGPAPSSVRLTSREACPAFAIGAQIGRLVAEHSRQDHLSVATSAARGNDLDAHRDADRCMKRAQEGIELLRAAATYQQATSIEGALAQVVLTAATIIETNENDDLDDESGEATLTAALRCLHSVSKVLSASTDLSPRVFGSDYLMSKASDALGMAWSVPRASYVTPGPKPTVDGTTTASVLSRLEDLSRQTEAWTKAYFDACDLETEADSNRDEPGAARRKTMAQMAVANAIRVRRTVLIDALAVPATTVREFGLQAQIIAAELREWWDNNSLEAGEMACRTLLDMLIGAAGVARVPDPDVTVEEARAWIDQPFAHGDRYPIREDEHRGYNHNLPAEA